jgi:anti-sigma B factor antagonist
MGTSRDFDVQTETTPGGPAVLRVFGELDLATVPRLEEALAAVSADLTVIDLSSCTFLDSSGVRALATAGQELSEAGRRFSLVASDPGLLRVLDITGVDTVLAVHQSTESALAIPPSA